PGVDAAEVGAELPADLLLTTQEAVTVSFEVSSVDVSLLVPPVGSYLCSAENCFIDLPEFTADSVILTNRAAQLVGARAGDELRLTLADGKFADLVIGSITTNYFGHYLYLGAEAYRDAFGELPTPNTALAIGDEALIADAAAGIPEIIAVAFATDIVENLSDATDALGTVTWVLVILAGALALVVLFNLTNITITERIRELATLKVLGLSDIELAMYIFRENIVVTAIGIITGLGGGILLHRFVLSTVQLDLVTFPVVIYPLSYLFAILTASAFALFVNVVMGFRLRNIEMVESLKSVE
ncbi:MAG: ABC transporter permease, partial [Promicromonosporaceae bacterium]|nr:ABC transporter permease [Promicromonosporaceae bacterium]